MKRALPLLLILAAVIGGIAWSLRPPQQPAQLSTRLAFVRGAEEKGMRYLIVDYVELKTGADADRWLQDHDLSCVQQAEGCKAPHGFVLANEEEKNEELPLADDARLIVSVNNMPVYQTVDFPVFAAKITNSTRRRSALYDRIPFAIDIDATGKAVSVREQPMPE